MEGLSASISGSAVLPTLTSAKCIRRGCVNVLNNLRLRVLRGLNAKVGGSTYPGSSWRAVA